MIRLNDVTLKANKKNILKNISLEIEQGKKYLLLGPSGSGKTSILKIMNYLYSPTLGSVTLDNEGYNEFKPHLLRRIVSLIMQDPIMFGEYVYENFDFVAKITGIEADKKTIQNLFVDFGLKSEFIDKKNLELSGGEKYRISIIRSLINKPRFILIDEPFAALDKTLMIKIFDYLINWTNNHNSGLVVVSHTFDNIIHKFDKVIFIKTGKLIFEGSPNTFLTSDNYIIKNFLAGNE